MLSSNAQHILFIKQMTSFLILFKLFKLIEWFISVSLKISQTFWLRIDRVLEIFIVWSKNSVPTEKFFSIPSFCGDTPYISS